MEMKEFMTPVALITFNRPELVKMQLKQLEKIRPRRLFFISDAAREGNEYDQKAVMEIRSLIDRIDWECELDKIFADQNMGCDARVVSGLNVVFTKVDKAIILEDDCLPQLSFFIFCESMLEKYKEYTEVMYISGTKWVQNYKLPYSYGFSYDTGTWGWATWKRAWQEWHWDRDEWEKYKYQWLKGIYSFKYRRNWIRDMEGYFSTKSIPWDYVWRFCVGKRLSIFPAVNLIENIGFDDNATHTKKKIYGYDGTAAEMEKIIDPPEIKVDLDYPVAMEKQFHRTLWVRVTGKLKLLFGYAKCKEKVCK